jgi:type I restriction enzyme M protein
MPACVIICRTKKAVNRKNKILFINAENEFAKTNTEIYLTAQNISKILDAYKNYTDIEEFAKVASIENIVEKNYKLSIAQYVIKRGVILSTEKSRKESYRQWETQMRFNTEQINKLISLIQ